MSSPAHASLNGSGSATQDGRSADEVSAGRPNLLLLLGLAAVTVVWLAGCAWSFEEQTRFADSKGFALPWLLPLVIDGMAVAMATVATAASLDGRAAVAARLMTATAIAASATSNATAASERELGDVAAVVLAAGVPVAANLAFEVLLGEIRRQVVRRRGQPAPVPIPYPRPIRFLLAPFRSCREWRHLVLALTELTAHETHLSQPATMEWASEQGTSEPVSTHDFGADPRIREIASLLAAGDAMTGGQVGARFGVSARTGRRILRRAEELHHAT